MQNMTLIKYDNRKIYSRELSKYLNHTQIIDLLSDGFTLKFETKTGEDITKEVEIDIVKTWISNKPEQVRKIINFIRG